jgi:hypothetical protein
MLPLELSDPDLFGDDLQLVSGCIAFLLEPAGSAIIVAELEEWEWLDDPEELPVMAGVVAGAGAGFHRMSLKPQRRLSGTKRDLKEL